MGEVLVLLTGDKPCHSKVLCSAIYYPVRMKHGNMSSLIIVNGDMNLIRDLEERLVPGQGEGEFWLLKYLELHEMILKTQESELEVRHEDTSAFQDLNLHLIFNHFIVKGSLMVDVEMP